MRAILPFVLLNDILLLLDLNVDGMSERPGLMANCFVDNSTFELLSQTTSKFTVFPGPLEL